MSAALIVSPFQRQWWAAVVTAGCSPVAIVVSDSDILVTRSVILAGLPTHVAKNVVFCNHPTTLVPLGPVIGYGSITIDTLSENAPYVEISKHAALFFGDARHIRVLIVPKKDVTAARTVSACVNTVKPFGAVIFEDGWCTSTPTRLAESVDALCRVLPRGIHQINAESPSNDLVCLALIGEHTHALISAVCGAGGRVVRKTLVSIAQQISDWKKITHGATLLVIETSASESLAEELYGTQLQRLLHGIVTDAGRKYNVICVVPESDCEYFRHLRRRIATATMEDRPLCQDWCLHVLPEDVVGLSSISSPLSPSSSPWFPPRALSNHLEASARAPVTAGEATQRAKADESLRERLLIIEQPNV